MNVCVSPNFIIWLFQIGIKQITNLKQKVKIAHHQGHITGQVLYMYTYTIVDRTEGNRCWS